MPAEQRRHRPEQQDVQPYRLAAQALREVAAHISPGVTTDELDRVGHEFLCDHGAYPSTLGYPGPPSAPTYPKSLCTSVNEVICHGIPSEDKVLAEGDIINIDITTMNDVIGGSFTARVNMNLREDKGWSYGVRSAIGDAVGPRVWQIVAQVQTDKTAESIEELLKP